MSYSLWEKYRDKIKLTDLSKEIQPIYSVLDSYHSKNEQKHDLSVVDMSNLLSSFTAKDKEYYTAVLKQLSELIVQKDTSLLLLNSLVQHKQLKEISLAAYDVTEGKLEIKDFTPLVKKFLEGAEQETDEQEYAFISDDLGELANTTFQKPGLRWRLNTFNRVFGSLRKGDFGFIFARPESGKTTLLASEASFMAGQLAEDSGPIIWLNNEEQGNKVKLRVYQATLGVTLPQLLSDIPGNHAKYLEQTRGKLKIFDSGIIHKSTVEALCRKYQPSLLIFDQIDKIEGFKGDREDLVLGAKYTWARELAKEYCPVIGVCQADGTGEGVKWLTMAHVANAKTAKQAEADWIAGIGKIADPGYENLRYLHASKNKLLGDPDTDPNLRHGKMEILISPTIARYIDIT